jgi:hypothetical protein
MHKPLLKLLCVFLLCFATFRAFCQTDALPGDDAKPGAGEKKDKSDASSSFKFGVTYVSNNVYMGRADTVTTPVIVPQLKYTLKSGIYFSGSLYFIPNKPKQKLDGADLEAGCDFDITDDFSGGASFTKLFYSSSSTQIASSISSTFNVNFDYDIADIITPTFSTDYNLNKQGIANDVLLSVGLAHDFITRGVFGDLDILLISPTITANAGTQNFYDAYLTKKSFKSVKRTKLQNTIVSNYINKLGQFELLDYELSAPIEYKTGHFILQLVPIYAIVQNQLPKGIAARLSDQSSIFYVEAGMSLKF